MPVIVVTDSNAHVPSDLVHSLGIRVVPLHVLVGDRDLLEGVDDVDAALDETDTPPTTSGASVGELTSAYTRALEASEGAGVLAVHISRQLSGTWDAARQACETLGDEVRLVDSGSAGMGTGFPVLAAARAAAAGAGLDQAYETATEVAGRGSALLYVDRLDHLRRGGRIGAAAAFLSTALSMRPVLQMVDGKLLLREKTRTASKALAKLVALAEEAVGERPVALAVQHWRAPERAKQIEQLLRERLPDVVELHSGEYGPVLGLHLGPGAVGLAVVPDGAGVEPCHEDARPVDGDAPAESGTGQDPAGRPVDETR